MDLYHGPPLGVTETMHRPQVQFFSREGLKQAFSWSTAAHVAVVAAAAGVGFIGADEGAVVELEESIRFTSAFEEAPTAEMSESTDIPNPVPEPDVEFVDPDDETQLPLTPLTEPKGFNPSPMVSSQHTPLPVRNSTVKRSRPVQRKPKPEPRPTPPVAAPAPTPPAVGTFVSARPNSKGCPSPTYPARALRHGISGRCVLSIRVNVDGSVDWIRLRQSSGHGILDRAAIAAVKIWRLTPATHAGQPVASERDVSILFTLPK